MVTLITNLYIPFLKFAQSVEGVQGLLRTSLRMEENNWKTGGLSYEARYKSLRGIGQKVRESL